MLVESIMFRHIWERPLPNETGIDYVVPMVFPRDRAWRKTYASLMGSDLNEHDHNMYVRFRSWGTEELLIRSVIRFMPWLRRIYIIVASGSQCRFMPWVDGLMNSRDAHTPEVRVVTHKEFIPEQFLPTFNSRAIEMFLHRIPGLSDYFIYGNDDMIPLSPLAKEDFFRCVHDDYGWHLLPCQRMKEKVLPENLNNFQLACLAGLNFVGSEFGQHFSNTMLRGGHTLAPIMRSSCLHLWQRGSQAIEASISSMRTIKNFNQYIYSWYQHFSGQYIEHLPPHSMAGVKSGVQHTLDVIARPDCGVVCINDHESCSDWVSFARAVRNAIEHKLMSYGG